MSLAFAALLIVIEVVGSIMLAIAVPFFFGMMAYDMIQSRAGEAVDRQTSSSQIAVKRGIARAFVVVGGLFWSVATFAELYSLRQTAASEAAMAAFIPLVACIATLIIGWYYERFAAGMLLVASLAVVAWGVIYQFQPGMWVAITLALIGPMLTASVLFWLARRDQEAYERVTALRPDLAFVFAARSSIH